MDSNVIKRLQAYCVNHADLIKSGVIKGIDSVTSEIVLEKNGIRKNLSIDILESNKFDFDKFEMINDINESHDNDVEVLEELVDLPNENNDIHIPKTIAELNEAIKNKDEKAIDKALETFAINEKTGVIDLNKAISIVTNNAVNEAVKCIMNETDFDKDMSKYDITGKKMSDDSLSQHEMSEKEVIKTDFNNLLIPYTEIAIIKGQGLNYTPENIEKACNKFGIMVEDKLKTKSYVKQEKPKVEEEKNYVPKLKPETMTPSVKVQNRGFADALILTIIVLVYAAIIINLILKLK